MQNVLLIFEDDSFKVLSMNGYVEYHMGYISFDKPIKQEIYREPLPDFTLGKYYISRKGPTETRRMSLSDFPEEIRSLLFLYEI